MTSPAATTDTNAQLLRALTSLKDMRGRLEAAEGARTEPIAIIGMSCRLPGAPDVGAFWELMRSGGDAITETPAERWDTTTIYDPRPDARGKVATRWGGFLDGIDRFDAAFFGISPREAAQMDPQQRLLLEVAWETLEDGGQSVERLAGTATGVFVGVHSHSEDYYRMQAADPRDLDLYSGTGTSHSVLSGRLSYLLDLRGPSIAIDTACSSSLVAVHLAVQSLRNRECSLALAGGVNTIIDPTFTMVASRMRMMSATGRCRPFDADGDGFVRAEGCATVLLKRLSDAVADGDRVLAVIKGTAVNQDGRSNGLTAPNSLSQQAVVRAALANAGLAPSAIGFVETHGTGTPLGDPIELEALTEVFHDVDRTERCALGSVKANIGHAEGAAGIAALVKTVLTLRAGEIPPLVHFATLNPHISLDGTPFVIPTAPIAWPAGHELRHAGVSSFGWSGTNAHVVVGEAPAAPAPHVAPADDRGRRPTPVVLPISARSARARADLAAAYCRYLADAPASAIADICLTAGLRRSHHDHRLAVSGRGRDELLEQLDAFLAAQQHRGLSVGEVVAGRRELLVFVFPGQGTQWSGMARGLLASEPVFRAALHRCADAMSSFVDWSLLEQIERGGPRFDDIDVIQPVLFAIQVALAELWASRGIEPDAVVGHSMGEVAAAHVAGILTLEDAARVICRRSRLLQRISGRGAMAVVELDIEAARAAIAGFDDRLSIAVSNSRTSTVLSGDPAALDLVMEALAADGTFCRRVNVDVASHSPQVEPLLDELAGLLDHIHPREARTAFMSTVTARFEDGPALDATYWAHNLRRPVLFTDATKQLLDTDHVRFVELSPHPALLAAVEESLRESDRVGATVASMQRDTDEVATMWSALGSLYAAGHDVDWHAVHPGSAPVVDLPTYPWQRERHWIDTAERASSRRAVARDHPLLGWTVPIAESGVLRVWENEIDRSDLREVFDHRTGGVPSLPASALLAMMSEAGAVLGGSALADVRFEQPLRLDDEAPTTVQIVLDPAKGAHGTVAVFSRRGDAWSRHATAAVAQAASDGPTAPAFDADTTRPGGADRRATGEALYGDLRATGIDIGPSLQCLTQVWADHDRVVAEISPASTEIGELAAFDACVQVAALLGGAGDGRAADGGAGEGGRTDSPFVPVSARHVRGLGATIGPWTCVATFAHDAPGDDAAIRTADVALYDAAGHAVAVVEGLVLQRLHAVVPRLDDCFFGVEWRPIERVATERASSVASWLLVAGSDPIAPALAHALRAEGAGCTLATRSERPAAPDAGARSWRTADDLRGILHDLAGRDDVGIVFLLGLDRESSDPRTPDIDPGDPSACGALVELVRAMAASGCRAPLRVVTRGVHRVGEADTADALAQAPLWGLGRAIREESPEIWAGLIDVDPAASVAVTADLLARELMAVPPRAVVETEIAFRGSTCFVPRIARQVVGLAAGPGIRPDATYLITGAFGSIGSQLAHWLVGQGARRLVLLGRTELPPRRSWDDHAADTPVGRRVALIRALERRGVAVHADAVDVGDATALTAYLDRFQDDAWPPIRGVFHAAAALGGQLIDESTSASFAELLRPKVIGARVLDEHLAELDHFVMFSSIASLVPVAGQGAYAAANAFLDAIAHARTARGQRGLSIDWGAWSASTDVLEGEAGQRAAADAIGFKDAATRLWAAQGMRAMRAEQALEALGRLLSSGRAQSIVASIDWSTFAASRLARPLALVADVVAEATSAVAAPDTPNRGPATLAELFAATPRAEQRDLVEATVRRSVSRILKLPESSVPAQQPFGTLGLDSLMAVELRNRLEAEVALKLPASMAWNYPTVRELADYLVARLDPAPATAPAAPVAHAAEQGGSSATMPAGMGEILAAVDGLSDDEALAALMEETGA